MCTHNIQVSKRISKKCNPCKCKSSRVRWFYSKGAFLVLFWVFLVSMSVTVTLIAIANELSAGGYYFDWLATIVATSIVFLTILPLGWLANTKFGVYNATKYGTILMLLSAFVISVLTLFFDYNFVKNHLQVMGYSICVVWCFYIIGGETTIVSILQLGLDQMPDASSSNITSFIVWLIFSVYAGMWIIDFLSNGYWRCLKGFTSAHKYSSFTIQIWSLCQVLCMSIVVATNFLFAKKWLIIEPKTQHTLKTAYRVLKFAWKHKAPLNRSALTYWEEDVPSRMDLGKSRFGGPFTTEQVEDVKVVLRLLVLSLPLWMVSFSVHFGSFSYADRTRSFCNWSSCNTHLITSTMYNREWWILITTVVFEFVIYPIVRDRLPSILKRIGIIAFTNFVLSVLFLILALAHFFCTETEYTQLWAIVYILFYLSEGIQFFLFSAILELVCAQAPYSTRGLFTGYFTICIGSSVAISYVILNNLSHSNYKLILFGVKCFISLFGLVFYCLLARWYKMRVRDEEYCTQRVVEEVYDRYLSPRINS